MFRTRLGLVLGNFVHVNAENVGTGARGRHELVGRPDEWLAERDQRASRVWRN